MDDLITTYPILIQRISSWADSHPGVRAAMIIGSRARTDHPADEWADLDVLLFVLDADALAQDESWCQELAPTWFSFLTRTPEGRAWERRITYTGGLDVDFAINPNNLLEFLLHNGLSPDVVDIIRRGVRILVDKEGQLAELLNISLLDKQHYIQPAEEEFRNSLNDFWHHSLWSAKHLLRGELWWAKSGSDNHLKSLLLRMLEWHAHAMRGVEIDTWLRGRFLEEWADPRALTDLKDSFAHYDADDIARTLLKTMAIYDWVSKETAQRWGYSFPDEEIKAVTSLVKELLNTSNLDQ